MDKKLLKGLIALIGGGMAASLSLASCSDDFRQGSDSEGRLYATVDLDGRVVTSAGLQDPENAPSTSRAAQTVAATDLKMRLTAHDGHLQKEWNSLAEFPASADYAVGSYTLEAYYGADDEEGFEKPYYYGSQELTLTEGKTTPVSITATLANAMVSIDYTEAFLTYFAQYNTTITSSTGTPIEFAPGETRPAYVKAGNVDLNVHIRKPNGVEATLQPASFEAQARHHYHMTFDVNGGEVGTAVLILLFDDMLDEEEVEIDLSDELLTAPAPEVFTKGFADGDLLSMVEANPSVSPLEVTFLARSGVAALEMTCNGTSLNQQGFAQKIDLLSATALDHQIIEYLGLEEIGTKKPEKMALINLDRLVKAIKYVEGDAKNNVTTFTFSVKDKMSKVSEPITLKVEVTPLVLALEEAKPFYIGETHVNVGLEYNGLDAQKDVTVQMKNERGTWENVTVSSVTPAAAPSRSNGSADFRLDVNIPENLDEIVLRPVTDVKTGAEVTLERQEGPVAVSVDDRNVFAKHALVELSLNSRDALSDWVAKTTLELSENGGAFQAVQSTLSGTDMTISSLKPSTKYAVRCVTDGNMRSRSVTFTTEADTQPNNGNMDTWTSDHVVGGHDYGDKKGLIPNYWKHWYPYDKNDVSTQGWETLNEHTLSDADCAAPYYCYVNTSGTIPTDDAVSGKAACVRTVGYGSGSTAEHIIPILKKRSMGELYLGSYDISASTPVYGINFASRPSSVSFTYKYEPKNPADYGYAVAEVYDAAGNKIASATLNPVTKVEAYTTYSLNLDYPKNTAKAAKILVGFVSSMNPDCLKIDSTSHIKDNFDLPPEMNLSAGEYVGSKFFVDNVVFNY